MKDCELCQRVERIADKNYPFTLFEFKNSYLCFGEHQYYSGYCVLVTKKHYKEMSDIPSPEREEIFQELMFSSKAIQNILNPKKMNLSSLGNVVEHLHWHLFPRYENDPYLKNPPWLQMQYFNEAQTDLKLTFELRQKLRRELERLTQ
jgi:diadenosine tetraphosphate (Ap4A) HIT family hydrolase